MLANAQNWRTAVCIAVDAKTNGGKCFSSGEIAKQIREERPDLVFQVYDIGQYLRDLYFNSNIVYTLDGASPIVAYQVSRVTDGKSRTPEGLEVFVYCPNAADGLAHDFEVQIPRPTGDFDDDDYQGYGTMDGETDERGQFDNGPIATVHKDGRLCIPRKAFDAFCMKSSAVIQPGDQIHIRLDKTSNKLYLTMNASDGSKVYDLTMDKGRVKYTPEDTSIWSNGDTFKIFIGKTDLVVDLN